MSTTPFNSDAKKMPFNAPAFGKMVNGANEADRSVAGLLAPTTEEPGAKEVATLLAPKTDRLSDTFDFVGSFLTGSKTEAKAAEGKVPESKKETAKGLEPATPSDIKTSDVKTTDAKSPTGETKEIDTPDGKKTIAAERTEDGKIKKFEDIFKFDSLLNPNLVAAKKSDEKPEPTPMPVREVITTVQEATLTYYTKREEEESKRLEAKREQQTAAADGKKEDGVDAEARQEAEQTEAKTLTASEFLSLQTELDKNGDGEVTRDELRTFSAGILTQLEELDRQERNDPGMTAATRNERAAERSSLRAKLEATSAINSRLDSTTPAGEVNEDVLSGSGFSFGEPTIFAQLNIPSFFRR